MGWEIIKPINTVCINTYVKLDDVDVKIISLLKENARATNTELAKKVNLTEGAIRHRIENLVKQGTVRRFTIDVASENAFYAIVMLKAKGDVKKMMHELSSRGLSTQAYEISGDFDGCTIIEAKSLSDIDTTIDQIRQLKNMRDTKTFMVLRKW